jgi:hypothetical protein
MFIYFIAVASVTDVDYPYQTVQNNKSLLHKQGAGK